uniref:Uncharacterized protein n=1 Tax=Lepeophtheirus salmonis TaxID=72036 RepID=A0A0K2TQW5_LEPSM
MESSRIFWKHIMAMGSDLINYSTKRHHIWLSISCIHEKRSFAKKNSSHGLNFPISSERVPRWVSSDSHHFHLDANVKEVQTSE